MKSQEAVILFKSDGSGVKVVQIGAPCPKEFDMKEGILLSDMWLEDRDQCWAWLLELFITIMVKYNTDAFIVHKAFLKIDEYKGKTLG